MRKLLATYAFLVTASFAAPILAPPAPPCIGIGRGIATDVIIDFPIWTAPGFFCEQAGKIFSNFAIESGLIAPNTTLQIQQQNLGGVNFHVVTFNANFLLAFSLSYDIAVDLVAGPNHRIVRVSGDLSNPSIIGSPILAKSVYDQDANLLGMLVATTNIPGIPIVTSQTSLHVLDEYLPLGGAAVSISNTFAQVEIPEPSTWFLIGSSMMLFGVILRRELPAPRRDPSISTR